MPCRGSVARPANADWAKPLEEVHGIAAHAFMVLAGVHAVAAIGHHVLLKDATLARMLPLVSPGRSNPGA